MNYSNADLVAESRRAELQREMEHIRLEQQALDALPRRGGVGRRMASLAGRMVARSQALRCPRGSDTGYCSQRFSKHVTRVVR